jgi:hypothetical protein
MGFDAYLRYMLSEVNVDDAIARGGWKPKRPATGAETR